MISYFLFKDTQTTQMPLSIAIASYTAESCIQGAPLKIESKLCHFLMICASMKLCLRK